MRKLSKTYYHVKEAEALLRRHEGVRLTPYHDSVGKLTIGVGRNLTDRGLSVDEVDYLFQNDMAIASDILDIWCAEWRQFSAARCAALLSMAFNLGGPRLSGFRKMRRALLRHDFDEAASQALDSKWASQVPRRAREIAAMIAKG